jgi:hypothetical protein
VEKGYEDGIRVNPNSSNNTIQKNDSKKNGRFDIHEGLQASCGNNNTWLGNKFKTFFGCATD